MPLYVVDTNIFIQAHRFYYPFDVMPSYWQKIKGLFHKGIITSIDKVKDELYEGKDVLYDWCNDNIEKDCFQDTQSIIADYADVVQWAQSMDNHYKATAIDTFMQEEKVDAWLVAFAKAHKLTLVTYEVSDPACKKNIKIPDACIPFGVTSISPIQLLRDLSITI